jgi:transposase
LDEAIEGSLVVRVLRTFSAKLKEELVRRAKAGESVRSLSAETGVLKSSLYQWLEADRTLGPAGLDRKRGRPRKDKAPPFGPMAGEPPSAAVGPPAMGPPNDLPTAQARIAELERLVGRQQLHLDFFQEALRSWDATSRSGDAPISSPSSKE